MPGLHGRPGLGAHRVIPAEWERQHRPVAEATMTAEVVILRHTSGGVWDEVAGRTTYPDPMQVWSGPARVQRMSQMEITRSIGDRQVVIRGYTVSLPADAPEIRIGDETQVTAPVSEQRGDPLLAGQPLWVHDVRHGSLIWQRDLVCLNAPPTQR
jgi:hypothetical protein